MRCDLIGHGHAVNSPLAEGLHTWTVALPCRVPQGPGVDYSMGVIITWLLPDSTRYYYEFVLPSDAKLDETCSKYSDSCIANRSSTQPTNSNRLNTQCSTLLAAALIWRDSFA